MDVHVHVSEPYLLSVVSIQMARTIMVQTCLEKEVCFSIPKYMYVLHYMSSVLSYGNGIMISAQLTDSTCCRRLYRACKQAYPSVAFEVTLHEPAPLEWMCAYTLGLFVPFSGV